MAKFIEVKSANINGIFEIIANRGVCWQVLDGEDKVLVQKKSVVRGPWEEEEVEPTPTPVTSVAAQLAAAVAPPAPAPADTPVITLKQLCFDLDLEPRIARRKLRNSGTSVGTGSRWEWEPGSEELNKVRALLAKPVPAITEEA